MYNYSGDSSSEDSYSGPSEDDDTLDSDGQRNAKKLSDLSRSVVSKNVKREKVCKLPLPKRLKKEIFKNLLTDRHGSQTKVYGRGSFPCKWDCSSFCSETRKSEWNVIPDWSVRAIASCEVNLMYDDVFPSDAPWLELPDRERLLRDLKSPNDERIALLNPLRFDRRSGLGDVHVWLNRFIFYKSQYDWFYLIVTAGCMKSFAKVAKLVDLVVLPYWCVSDYGTRFGEDERIRIADHRRCMIVVVRDRYSFQSLLKNSIEFVSAEYESMRRRGPFPRYNIEMYRCTKLSKVMDLAKAIARVGRPREKESYEQTVLDDFTIRHYYVANPVVRHAEWWMMLMASFGGFDELVLNRLESKKDKHLLFGKRIFWRRNVSAAVELNVENCVVRFDPPDTCIGDPVPESELLDYVRSGKPFVFGFDSRILSTFRTNECPTDLPAYNEWCVSNEINTLLNFDRKDIVEHRPPQMKFYYEYPTVRRQLFEPFITYLGD